MARILVLCTGNINRSPFTAAVLQSGLGAEHEVDSAGFTADGMASPERMVAAAQKYNVPLEAHRSALVTGAVLDAADLIIVMDRSHQAMVAGVSIDAPERAFLLSELVLRLRAAPPPVGQTLVEWVGAQRRSPHEVLNPDSPDVDDPMGRPARAYRKAAKEMYELAESAMQMMPRT